MESDSARLSPSTPTDNASYRRERLIDIIDELNNLLGQNQSKIGRGLFTALVHATGVSSGRLFLTDENGQLEYCLLLVDENLSEYDEITSPPLRDQAIAGWVYRQRRGILITDISKDPRRTSWAESPEVPSTGSAIAVPILAAAYPIGSLALISQQPDHFSKAELNIISNLAHHAAVIIENTRLTTRVHQKQDTIAALHQSTRALSTSPDIGQILRTILRQLTNAVPFQYGMILLREGTRLRPVTAAGSTDLENFSSTTFTPTHLPALFHALGQGRTIVSGEQENLSDLATLGFPPAIRSWSIAPLVAKKEILGGAILASPHLQGLDTQYVPIINAFADHAAIAVANHRLAQETDRRLRELAFLYETGQAITSTLDLDRILQLLLEKVRDLLQIDAASIALRDEPTGDLIFEAASGEGASDVIGIRLKPGQGIAGWVAETGKPLVVQDAYNDERFYAGIDRRTGIKTQAILCIPIVLKGHVVGVIEALNPGEVPFDAQAIELLNALSGLAATAIDNARLFAQVRSTEARYEGLFEDSANPIIITDLKGSIVEANRNACTLLGQTKEALQGTNIAHLRSAAGDLDFVAPLEHIQTEKEVSFQTTIIGPGQWTTVAINVKQILVKGTAVIQWIGRDISAEIELEQTREDMVRMIVHDLRNPLANMMNSLDVLHDVILENDDSISRDELLKIAKRSGKRMHQLISSILDISRLETGQAILEKHPTDLEPLIREAVEFIQPQADIREIQLTISISANLRQVEIDRDMISRVVLNLLDNASKFTPIGGAISLTAHTLGEGVEVIVTDSGSGIPKDQLKKIFEKFTRVRQANGPQGTGLGLAFCQLAVESHGGEIWAESALGQGSTFRFTLPAHAPEKAT